MLHGDGAGCLQLLAARHDSEADELRAKCTMKRGARGDCERGRNMLAAFGRAHGWDAWLAAAVREADYTYCRLDAGARSEWAARARFRMVLATTANTSCKPVLAFMKREGIQLPAQDAMLEATCHVSDGDCEAGRKALRRGLVLGETEASRVAERERASDEVFAKAYPACK